MSPQDIIRAILDGDVDGHEKQVVDALNQRRRLANAHKALAFQVGDTVRFNATARPRYLVGVTGTVTKVNASSVVVAIGPDGGRFANSSPRCPIGLVDLVEEVAA